MIRPLKIIYILTLLTSLNIKGQDPGVINIHIAGTNINSDTDTAKYTYTGSAPELNTSFIWYSASDTMGISSILSSTSNTLSLTTAEIGKYFQVEIIPQDNIGTIGTPAFSYWKGPVTDSPPSALNVIITGSSSDSSLLTLTYTYQDKENDAQNGTVIQWISATDINGTGSSPIVGANNLTYLLSPADLSRFVAVKVTPKDIFGNTGETVLSNWIGPVTNLPPMVSSINITGTFLENNTLTASYAYYDFENNAEKNSVYSWYSATSSDGTGSALIAGASGKTYLLTTNENNKYIAFGITPKDAFGSTGTHVQSAWFGPVINAAPVASNVQIQGQLITSQQLSATFDYTDAEGDAAGNHLYKWFRSPTSEGSTYSQVQSSTSEIYTLKSGDENYYFRVFVTPVAVSGTSPGIEVPSTGWIGPVTNAAPVAQNLQISGSAVVCKTLTGTFDYSDPDNDLAGTHLYRWLRSATPTGAKTAIPGATHATYTLTTDDQNDFIFFEVTPKAQSGTLTGVTKISTSTTSVINSLPTVTFSPSNVSICKGNHTNISLTFTGTPPFSLTYSDSVTTHVINTSNTNYILNASTAGVYKGISLTDNLSCPVTDLPSQTHVTVLALPNVQITNLSNAYSLSTSRFQLLATPVGGVFKGDGVVTSGGKYYFDPSVVGVTVKPIPVIYTYNATCSNADTVLVTILDADAFLAGFRPQKKYCTFDEPFLITAATNVPATIGNFSIAPNKGLTDHHNNTATIDPSVLSNGSYTITYTYVNTIPLTISETITVETINAAKIFGISTSSVCSNNAPIAISGTPASGVFKGNGITNVNGIYYFNAASTNETKNTISYTDSTSYGCKTSDAVTLTIVPAPVVNFDFQDKCWRGDSTRFSNTSYEKNTINNWAWNFGDNLSSGSDNSSSKYEPTHKYQASGEYIVSLTGHNLSGCLSTIQKPITLADLPNPNFSWDKECFNKSVKTTFINSSSGSGLSYVWTIKDNSTSKSVLTTNFAYSFSQPGDYSIGLKATSNAGCQDSITRVIHVRPIFTINNGPYENDFENPKNLWYIEQNSMNNWRWGQPDGQSISGAYSGINAYYTKFISAKVNEQLVVSSPCFDFTNVQKPYIEMWINSNSNLDQEGAVLQYAIDGNNTWTTVGNQTSGSNWYTSSSIESNPGGQQMGWSGILPSWTQARSNIDAVINKNNVKFRFVYGENTSSKKEGFAFDNVKIDKHIKTALFEHFTNLGSSLANGSNTYLENIIEQSGPNAISLQYHTSFPGTDSLNAQNQSDPGARALFYGAGNIPVCFLDGGFQSNYVYNFVNKMPNSNDISNRILMDVPFDLSISTEKNDNAISGSVVVRALKNEVNIPLTLYIAVAEDIQIQSQGVPSVLHNVLKQLIPSAAGTAIHMDWTQDQTKSFDFQWTFKNVYDAKNIKVVAFVQNSQTHEIFQAATTDIYSFNGLPGANLEKLTLAKLYPNPANEYTTITFPKPLSEDADLQIFNELGTLVKSERIQNNTETVIISTNDLSGGIYIVRILQRSNRAMALKLMIVH